MYASSFGRQLPCMLPSLASVELRSEIGFGTSAWTVDGAARADDVPLAGCWNGRIRAISLPA
jgi:hypothetical protein